MHRPRAAPSRRCNDILKKYQCDIMIAPSILGSYLLILTVESRTCDWNRFTLSLLNGECILLKVTAKIESRDLLKLPNVQHELPHICFLLDFQLQKEALYVLMIVGWSFRLWEKHLGEVYSYFKSKSFNIVLFQSRTWAAFQLPWLEVKSLKTCSLMSSSCELS